MDGFLSIAETAPSDLQALLDLAAAVKDAPDRHASALAGRSVGLFFMKPSTRTRVSSEVATTQLGGSAVVLGDEGIGLGRRETAADVARVLERYLDALAMRVFDHSDLTAMREAAGVPIINLLSDLEHPCQALADVLTIAEHRPIPDSAVAYVGDGNNVAQSLMAAVTKLGGEMRVAVPEGYEPTAPYLGGVSITTDPYEAVEGADVVYTDVWTSMGQESESETRRAAFDGFTVDENLFAHASADAIFLHCLPAHRGDEVTSAVMDHDRSRVFDQAENRLHSFKAILLKLLG